MKDMTVLAVNVPDIRTPCSMAHWSWTHKNGSTVHWLPCPAQELIRPIETWRVYLRELSFLLGFIVIQRFECHGGEAEILSQPNAKWNVNIFEIKMIFPNWM